jgi:hypothetical protein
MCVTPGVIGTDPVEVAVLPKDVAAVATNFSPRPGVYRFCLLPAALVSGAQNVRTEVIESQGTLESFRIVRRVSGLDGKVEVGLSIGAEEEECVSGADRLVAACSLAGLLGEVGLWCTKGIGQVGEKEKNESNARMHGSED